MSPRRLTVALVLAAVASAGLAGRVHAQCLLANPSFEIGGQSGAVFGGWIEFGSVGSVSGALHGARAARVSGPNSGGWDVSGFWQAQTSAAGDRWLVNGFVRVPSARPLAGQSKAIVNIEWRSSGGALIGYESHDVATSASVRDTFLAFAFTTAPAPTGTASARLLLGVLQAPGDPQRDTHFDRVRFEKQTVPSLDDLQWNDFWSGRSLSFAGRTWRVKGSGYYGPGPNSFTNSAAAVYVDAGGRLHLTITQTGGTWYSTEVALTQPLGYGDYVFTTRGRLDTFDPTTVLGLYVWEYGPCYDPAYLWWNPHNETDVEFSRWGIPGGPNGQYVTQPWDWAGNRMQFSMSFAADEVTSHAFRWRPDQVEYRSWRGGAQEEAGSPRAASWTYNGPHIPRPDQPRVHLNLWQVAGPPATAQEAVVEDFRFTPWSPELLAAPSSGGLAPEQAELALAGRHPARDGATLLCTIPRAGELRVVLHDAAGREIRVLDGGVRSAGAYPLAWDGRDAAGRPVPPGVYLARLVGAHAVIRFVLLR